MKLPKKLKDKALNLSRALLILAGIRLSKMPLASNAVRFVRVLNPVDPWLKADAGDQRVSQFVGTSDKISIAMTSRCKDSIVLASFHGARRKPGFIRPSLFCFYYHEVNQLGGLIDDTSADPPWPPEYNHAHHDITTSHQAVASAMSELSQKEPTRVVIHSDISIFTEIARLLQRPDLPSNDKEFRPKAAYRLRRLFRDGGEFRDMWIEIAKIVPEIAYDQEIMAEFRKMWASNRQGWSELSARLPLIAGDKRFSSG
jgi:hypothetical protein